MAWGLTAGQWHRQLVSSVPCLLLFPVTCPGLLSPLPWGDLPPPCTPLTLPVTSARWSGMGSWQRSPSLPTAPPAWGRKSLSPPALAFWPGPLSSKPQPGKGSPGPSVAFLAQPCQGPQLVKARIWGGGGRRVGAGIQTHEVGVFTGISLLPTSPRPSTPPPHLSCDGGREGGKGLARRQRAARAG